MAHSNSRSPFNIGDYIIIDDLEYGYVTDIYDVLRLITSYNAITNTTRVVDGGKGDRCRRGGQVAPPNSVGAGDVGLACGDPPDLVDEVVTPLPLPAICGGRGHGRGRGERCVRGGEGGRVIVSPNAIGAGDGGLAAAAVD